MFPGHLVVTFLSGVTVDTLAAVTAYKSTTTYAATQNFPLQPKQDPL